MCVLPEFFAPWGETEATHITVPFRIELLLFKKSKGKCKVGPCINRELFNKNSVISRQSLVTSFPEGTDTLVRQLLHVMTTTNLVKVQWLVYF